MRRGLVRAVVCGATAAILAGCSLAPTDKKDAAAKPEETPKRPAAKPVILIETSLGAITAELWPDLAPKTVANFLRYVDDGFYDGLVFHRVIDGFMIQGGGFSAELTEKGGTRPPVVNEAQVLVRNERGTLAMARTSEIDSATAQFFINLVDNRFLDHRDESQQGFGYCVFGRVIGGMEVVDGIGKVKTRSVGLLRDVPEQAVQIRSVRRAP